MITELVFCLIVCGINGDNRLEINCKGNLNKLKESDGIFNFEDGSFWSDDGGFVTDNDVGDDFGMSVGGFVTEDWDFGTGVDNFVPENGNFVPEDGNFVTKDGDLVTMNENRFGIHDCCIRSGSGWDDVLDNETQRYFLVWVIVCIIWKYKKLKIIRKYIIYLINNIFFFFVITILYVGI